MTWLPIGPRFVMYPKIGSYAKISRSNEQGCQAQAHRLAVDPRDPRIVYAIERPWSGGATVFRSIDAGASWTPITDALQRNDPNIDPYCIAINSFNSTHICVGAFDHRSVFVSFQRGHSWEPRASLPAKPHELVIDAMHNRFPNSAHVYAATEDGLWLSTDGGRSFPTKILDGEFVSLAFNYDGTGVHAYAARRHRGVLHSTNPSDPASWSNLNDLGIGLPAHVDNPTPELQGNFYFPLVAVCPRRFTRAYAWFMTRKTNGDLLSRWLYTTDDPRGEWRLVKEWPMDRSTLTQAERSLIPDPFQGTACMRFAVAPSSSGLADAEGNTNDVLMFAEQGIYRSVDGGRSWEGEQHGFHVDQHDFAFAPAWPDAGVIPLTYEANDGGVCVSTRFADPAYTITDTPAHRNEGDGTYIPGLWENRNHGKQSLALYHARALASAPALLYTSAQDTWLAAGGGLRGWRGFAQGDGGGIVAGQAADGVVVWMEDGIYNGWPGIRLSAKKDTGSFGLGGGWCRNADNSSRVEATSSGVTLQDGACLIGAAVGQTVTTLASPIPGSGTQTATVSDPAALPNLGPSVIVGHLAHVAEFVRVESLTATGFTANFGRSEGHEAGEKVLRQVCGVYRVDAQGLAVRVSQDFGAYHTRRVVGVALSRVSDHNAWAVTWNGSKDEAWRKPMGPITQGETWIKVDQDQPGPYIAGIAIGPDATFALLRSRATTPAGATPLYRLYGDRWEPVACAGLPAGEDFRSICAHPLDPARLYAAQRHRVYELSIAPGFALATWRDISDGLPGSMVQDLWLDVSGSGVNARVLARAATRNRALWEMEVTTTAAAPAGPQLYLRKNFLDDGRVPAAAEGLRNPYRPTETLTLLESADIKLDARVEGGVPYYQTGPYIAALPVSDTDFEQLDDKSLAAANLPANLLHVQVHNRSAQPADGVHVWAIYCAGASVLPRLGDAPSFGNDFPFWEQFTSNGIQPSLPADSPWRSAGAPRTLNGIDAVHAQVASWWLEFPVTQQLENDYTLVAFVHSAQAPVSGSLVVDELVRESAQVGVRRVHVNARVVLAPGSWGERVPIDRGPRPWRPIEPHDKWRERIPIKWPIPRSADLELQIDFSDLPSSARVSVSVPEGADGLKLREARAAGMRTRPAFAWLLRPLVGLLNLLRAIFGRPPILLPPTERRAWFEASSRAPIVLSGFDAAKQATDLEIEVAFGEQARGSVLITARAGGKTISRQKWAVPAAAEAPAPDERDKLKMKRPPDWSPQRWLQYKRDQRRHRGLARWVMEDLEARWREADNATEK
jgi:hypothetical protein